MPATKWPLCTKTIRKFVTQSKLRSTRDLSEERTRKPMNSGRGRSSFGKSGRLRRSLFSVPRVSILQKLVVMDSWWRCPLLNSEKDLNSLIGRDNRRLISSVIKIWPPKNVSPSNLWLTLQKSQMLGLGEKKTRMLDASRRRTT